MHEKQSKYCVSNAHENLFRYDRYPNNTESYKYELTKIERQIIITIVISCSPLFSVYSFGLYYPSQCFTSANVGLKPITSK